MKLRQEQIDKLWGETGPYSEAKLIFETRILDDEISRFFIEVRVHINPLTYEIVRDNIDHFKDDKMINDLIEHAEFQGFEDGYIATAFLNEYKDESVLKQAKKHLEYSEKTIIKMHKFVMNLLGLGLKK